jgi:hypothetical protein
MRDFPRPRSFVVGALVAFLTCAIVSSALGRWAARSEGLVRAADARAVRWTGVLQVPSGRVYDIGFDGIGPGGLWLDRVQVLRSPDSAPPGDETTDAAATVWLAAGFHDVAITAPPSARGAVTLWWAPSGETRRPLEGTHLLRALPPTPRLRLAAETASGWLRVAAWAAAALCAWFLLSMGIARGEAWLATRGGGRAGRRWRRAGHVALPTLVVLLAALLRFEALTVTYGPVQGPSWLRTVQERSVGVLAHLHPADFAFEPAKLYPHKDAPPSYYSSDPHTYLGFARAMRWFYAAHYREPVFPFTTKVWLGLLGGQDVAVSFASLTFSVLSVVAVYLLGSVAFSRWVGLGAAVALAVEHEAIVEGVSGWRDDAFTFGVAIFAWALVRWSRSPTRSKAALIGAAAGFVCLVRITALSFVVPSFLLMPLLTARSWRTRLGEMGLAAAVSLAVAGPYIVNCWIAFGDPLYAINVHANVYRITEGQGADPQATAFRYIGSKLRTRPLQTLQTGLTGLTTYPFRNKWAGFDAWSPEWRAWLSSAALLGLLLFAATWRGRLLLVVLVSSLLPYALTWRVGPDWRFTEHAYPFFLVASALAVTTLARWLTPGSLARAFATRRVRVAPAAAWAALLLAIAAFVWLDVRVLPRRVVQESLAAGEDTSIEAGEGGAFIHDGWSPPFSAGSVTSRVLVADRAEIAVPLPAARDHRVTIRLDPFPRPEAGAGHRPVVALFVNGTFVSRFETRFSPDRVGVYDVLLPGTVVHEGINEVAFAIDHSADPAGAGDASRPVRGLSSGSTIALWYVRLHP